MGQAKDHNLASSDQDRKLSTAIPAMHHCLVKLNHGAHEKNMRGVARMAEKIAQLLVAVFS